MPRSEHAKKPQHLCNLLEGEHAQESITLFSRENEQGDGFPSAAVPMGRRFPTVGAEIAHTETLEGESLSNSRNFCAGHSFHLGTTLETLTKEKPSGGELKRQPYSSRVAEKPYG